jgi:hypothetical protein
MATNGVPARPIVMTDQKKLPCAEPLPVQGCHKRSIKDNTELKPAYLVNHKQSMLRITVVSCNFKRYRLAMFKPKLQGKK